MALKYDTKKGKHGTLYLYSVEYEDADDRSGPVHTLGKYAYDDGHIRDWAADELPSEGWRMVRFAKKRKDVGKHRWAWHR